MMLSFADIQILRYELPGWETLSLRQKQFIRCISEATLWGRDITFDQFGKYNLAIRKLLEAIYLDGRFSASEQWPSFVEYLRRVWFSNGIYHHYSCQKFLPEFSVQFFTEAVNALPEAKINKIISYLPETVDNTEQLLTSILPVMFDKDVLPIRVNHRQGDDLLLTSAGNFYEGVSQTEAEEFYCQKKAEAVKAGADSDSLPSFGLNSRLVKDSDGVLREEVYSFGGRYSSYIEKICYWLDQSLQYADDDAQRSVIEKLIQYYRTGDLRLFDEYSIQWVSQTSSRVDFINGFIEVYADPIGLKGSWEGIVHYKDLVATQRAMTLSENAQWFEDNSPVDPRFKKMKVKGVSANVVCAAMLGGDEYPSTAIGINLPNSDWIRSKHGSKSITISNLTAAYDKASEGNGFRDEFIPDASVREMIKKYGSLCDDLHTDLHECLGHGSGQLLNGVSPDALSSYSSTIEEARADLFALYYIADEKLVELNLLSSPEAYKSNYYTYLLNGLLTQSVRISLGDELQEAHMRNRALIANWVFKHADGAMELCKDNGKTFLVINDYAALRKLFASLLAEIQRIKSTGDLAAARDLVETYGIKLDYDIHKEILERYRQLHIAPYKGFLNPVFREIMDNESNVVDIEFDITEPYDKQMMRYGTDYSL